MHARITVRHSHSIRSNVRRVHHRHKKRVCITEEALPRLTSLIAPEHSILIILFLIAGAVCEHRHLFSSGPAF